MEERKKLTARKHAIPGSNKVWTDKLLAALKLRVPDFVKVAVARVEGAVARAEARVEGAIARVEGAVKRRVESQAKARAKSRAKVKRAEPKVPPLKSREVKGGQGRRAFGKAAPLESRVVPPSEPPPRPGAALESAPVPDGSSSEAVTPKAGRPSVPSTHAASRPEPRRQGRHPRHPEPRPITEGFFVAPPSREAPAPSAPAVRPPAPPDAEGLGELPSAYERDSVVAMARDPRTLFVFWSFGQRTFAEAAAALDSPVSRIRVYDGETLVHEEPFSLEARNAYVSGLPPGRRLRVELHLVGRDGGHRRLGPSSSTVMLPSEGPGAETRIRFMRVDPGTPLDESEASISEEREHAPYFIAWDRLPLPGSAEGAGARPPARKRAGRIVPPPGGEASPDRGWSPLSPSGQGPELERGWAPPTPSGKVPQRLFPRWRSWVPTPSGQGLGVKVTWGRALPRLAPPPPARGWAPPSASGQAPEGPERGWAPPSASGPAPEGPERGWAPPSASGPAPGGPDHGWVPPSDSGQGPGVVERDWTPSASFEQGGEPRASGQGPGVGAVGEWGGWAPVAPDPGPDASAFEAHGGPEAPAPAPEREMPRAEPSPAPGPPAPVQAEDVKPARAERDWPAAVSAEGIVTATPPGRRRRRNSNPGRGSGSGSSR